MFMMTLPFGKETTHCEEKMQAKDPLARLLCADCEFLAAAGPAVLRLKLLEATHLAESRRLPQEVREAARQAAAELRELIRVRPCVSLIDYQAKRAVTGRCAIEAPTQFCVEAGHA
jgi:hypothetical protein